MNWQGIFTALATPFKDNQIDWDSLQNLLHSQTHVDGFIVNGTTAESPTLTWQEVESIFRFVLENKSPEQKVMLGTGSNCTRTTIEKTQSAKNWGADAALIVVPYYNKPNSAGLRAHFTKIANEVDIPQVLYNVPSRTIAALSVNDVVELSGHKNVVGVKDATGDLSQLQEMKSQINNSFTFLSGDDPTGRQYIQQGGDGIISVCSHLVSQEMKSWWSDSAEGLSNTQWDAVFQLLSMVSNPVPLKYALYRRGILSTDEVRLPLVTLNSEQREKADQLMSEVGWF